MSFIINLKVCRVCMQTNDGKSLMTDDELRAKFTFSTGIDLAGDMPPTICSKCEMKLKVAYDFIKMAQKSDRQLAGFLKKVSQAFQSVQQEHEPRQTGDSIQDDDALEDLLNEPQDKSPDRSESVSSVEVAAAKNRPVVLNMDIQPDVPTQSKQLANVEPEQCIIRNEDPPAANIEDSADSQLDVPQNSLDHIVIETFDQNDHKARVKDEFLDYHDTDYMGDDNSGFEAIDYGQAEFIELEEEDDVATESADGALEHYEIPVEDFNETLPRVVRPYNRKNPKDEPRASYYCKQCNRDFSTRPNLNRHMLTHDGRRPFICNVCGKSFSQNTTLKSHMYTHTGERPFVCTVCERGFTQSKSLVFHMRRHTDHKPFMCSICGMAFRQKHGLKTHTKKHHPEVKTADGTPVNPLMYAEMRTGSDNGIIAADDHQTDSLMDLIVFDDQMGCTPSDLESTVTIVDTNATSTFEPSRAKKFQCRKCMKCFNLQISLLRHLKMHEEREESPDIEGVDDDVGVL